MIVAFLLKYWRVIAVVILLAGAVGWIRHSGVVAGRLGESVRQIEADRKQLELERGLLKQRLTESQAREMVYASQAARREEEAIRLDGELASLRKTRRALPAITSLPTVAELPAKCPNLPAEQLQSLQTLLRDYPLLQKENDLLTQRVTAGDQQAAALKGQVIAVHEQREAWRTWAVQVEGHYVVCYNSLPRKRNWLLTIVTFGILGKPAKLNMPDPAAFGLQRPQSP